MSIFAVTLERLARVDIHPNADRLSIAQLASMTYQFVIPKGEYQVGDMVVYFPIDSLLPTHLIIALGLDGKLSGPTKNRVKTVRLRGQISQGVIGKPAELLPFWKEGTWNEGQDVTDLLGVVHYEPPIVPSKAGNLVRLPPHVSVYDIEGAERFAALVEQYLIDANVLITEKLEGSHWAISLNAGGEVEVCQRRYKIVPKDGIEHDWHKVARTSGLAEKLPEIKQRLEDMWLGQCFTVTLRGELIGPSVQGNIYGLADHEVRLFEIEVNGTPISALDFIWVVEGLDLPYVPILAERITLRKWLNGRSLTEASNGQSALNSAVLREGIVIRPWVEARDDVLGRVILKQRSPDYLASNDN